MNPFTEIATGIGYLFRGLGLLSTPGLRRYIIGPILVNCLLMLSLTTLLGWQLAGWVHAWLADLPDWLAWLEHILWWLLMALSILAFGYFFTVLANLLASPFNGMLSARVEALISGCQPNSGMSLSEEMWDGLSGELKRLRYYASRALLLGIISLIVMFIPLLHLVIAPAWFIFGALMLAYEYLDLPMGNRGLHFKAKITRLYSRGWRHLGFGGAVTLFALIPLANLVVIPAAVIGATLLYMETGYTPIETNI